MLIDKSTENIDQLDFLTGRIILIDKELEWTSFDVVAKVRNMLRRKFNLKKIKVGHGGTLDPLASGLVVICAGKATKQAETYQSDKKEYVAEVKLGFTTASFDAETEEEASGDASAVTEEMLKQIMEDKFMGEIAQRPPIFSAKSVDGVRAYKKAREGKHVELKENIITIYEIELIHFDAPFATIRVKCSKGTYIRSLANDIGAALGCGAYLSGLRRTSSGEYHVNNAISVEEFEKRLKVEKRPEMS